MMIQIDANDLARTIIASEGAAPFAERLLAHMSDADKRSVLISGLETVAIPGIVEILKMALNDGEMEELIKILFLVEG